MLPPSIEPWTSSLRGRRVTIASFDSDKVYAVLVEVVDAVECIMNAEIVEFRCCGGAWPVEGVEPGRYML